MKVILSFVFALLVVVAKGDSQFHLDSVIYGEEFCDQAIAVIEGLIGESVIDQLDRCQEGDSLYQSLTGSAERECLGTNVPSFFGTKRDVHETEVKGTIDVSKRAAGTVPYYKEILVGFPTDHTFLHVDCSFSAALELVEQTCSSLNHVRFTASVHDQFTRLTEQALDYAEDSVRLCGDSAEVLIAEGLYRGFSGGEGVYLNSSQSEESGCVDGDSAEWPLDLGTLFSSDFSMVELTDHSSSQFLCQLNNEGEMEFKLEVDEIATTQLSNQNLVLEFSCVLRSYKAVVLALQSGTSSL